MRNRTAKEEEFSQGSEVCSGSQRAIHLPTLAQELRIEPETLYEAALGFCWWPDGIEHN